MKRWLIAVLILALHSLSLLAQEQTPHNIINDGIVYENADEVRDPSNGSGMPYPTMIPQGAEDLERTITQLYGDNLSAQAQDEILGWQQLHNDPDWWASQARNTQAEWRRHRIYALLADYHWHDTNLQYMDDLNGLEPIGKQQVSYINEFGIRVEETIPEAYLLRSDLRPDAFPLFELMQDLATQAFPNIQDEIDKYPAGWPPILRFLRGMIDATTPLIDSETDTIPVPWLPTESHNTQKVRNIFYKMWESFKEEQDYDRHYGMDTQTFFNTMFESQSTNFRDQWRTLSEQDIATQISKRNQRTQFFLDYLSAAERSHLISFLTQNYTKSEIIFVNSHSEVQQQFQTLASSMTGQQLKQFPKANLRNTTWNMQTLPTSFVMTLIAEVKSTDWIRHHNKGITEKGCNDDKGYPISHPEVIEPFEIFIDGHATLAAKVKITPAGAGHTLMRYFTFQGRLTLDIGVTPEGESKFNILKRTQSTFVRMNNGREYEATIPVSKWTSFSDPTYSKPNKEYLLEAKVSGYMENKPRQTINLSDAEANQILGGLSTGVSTSVSPIALEISGNVQTSSGRTETRTVSFDFSDLTGKSIHEMDLFRDSIRGWMIDCPTECIECDEDSGSGQKTTACEEDYCERPVTPDCSHVIGSFWVESDQECQCFPNQVIISRGATARCMDARDIRPTEDPKRIEFPELVCWWEEEWELNRIDCGDLGAKAYPEYCYEYIPRSTLRCEFRDNRNRNRKACFDAAAPTWVGCNGDLEPGTGQSLPGTYDFRPYVPECQSDNAPSWCSQLIGSNPDIPIEAPDLAVTGVAINENVLPGEPLEVIVTILNRGRETSPNCRFELQLSNSQNTTTHPKWVGSLSPGATRSYTINTADVAFYAAVGTNVVTANANSNDAFPESTYDNNQLTTSLSLSGSTSANVDLRIRSIAASADNPVTSQTVHYSTQVSNIGINPSQAVQYQAWIAQNGNVVHTQMGTVPALQPNATHPISLSYTFATPGNYTVNFIADINSSQNETDETNNQSSRRVRIAREDTTCYDCTSGQPNNALGTELCLANNDGTTWTGSRYRCMGVRANGTTCVANGNAPNGWADVGPRCPDPATLPAGMNPDACGTPNICPGTGSGKRSEWLKAQQARETAEILLETDHL